MDEAGLLRRKSAVSIMAQIIGGLAIESVLWHIVGFTLVFGDTQGEKIERFRKDISLIVSSQEDSSAE